MSVSVQWTLTKPSVPARLELWVDAHGRSAERGAGERRRRRRGETLTAHHLETNTPATGRFLVRRPPMVPNPALRLVSEFRTTKLRLDAINSRIFGGQTT